MTTFKVEHKTDVGMWSLEIPIQRCFREENGERLNESDTRQLCRLIVREFTNEELKQLIDEVGKVSPLWQWELTKMAQKRLCNP